ncbi:MAG: cellulose biosynthesis cyclic di-GMP-binding regulatory protein BcsB [Aquificae bacterium]|nr:cellulose biosynthesis cyclic di-GMP-binding regulatory protein BcsB [Aquificota bacterium]
MVKRAILGLSVLLGISLSAPLEMDFKEVKKFPYIKYTTAWEGTPAKTKDVAVPNVYIVYGEGESKEVIRSAARIAFFLGQWTDDLGINPKLVKSGKLPKLLIKDTEIEKYTDRHLIVVGTNNKVVKELGLKFEKPTLKVLEKDGRKILIVGGKDEKQVLKASNFLADRIIGFKAGAYTTFFSWVRVRGMIEHENFVSALDILRDARGVHACGRNMSLAAPMMAKFPPEVKKVIKKRNKIMYVELPKALEEKNKEKALKLWREAMITCFQCHQGIGVPKLRKFEPLADIHSKHQRIAKRYGLSCKDCHYGITEYRGYEEGTTEE